MITKTVTKTVGHNEHSESRRVVRADCKRPIYPSLPSWKLERVLELYVSRVKGKGLYELWVTVLRNLSGSAGMFYARLKVFFLRRFFVFERSLDYE